MSINVISKGKFDRPKSGDFVNLTHFLLTREEGHNFLLLKLANDRDETVTAVTLEITQKDARGVNIDVFTVNRPVTNGPPHSPFVLDGKIAMSDACADFTVKILAADFGNFHYASDNGELTLSYQKHPYRDNGVSRVSCAAEQRTSRAKVRSFRISVVACVFMLAVAAIAMVFTYFHLQNFVANTNIFYYEGVMYLFPDGNSPDSDVYVVGSKDTANNIVIPERIKGHKVVGIADDAFRNNYTIESITVKAPIRIPDYAFASCSSLRYANLEKATQIGNSAFANCYQLQKVVALNLSKIGDFAFQSCNSLRTASFSNANSILTLGASVFSDCRSLTNVTIDQYVDYSSGKPIFAGSAAPQSLHLKNYNHTFEFNGESYPDTAGKTIAQLFDESNFWGGSIGLRSLSIEYCDAIPDYFCKDLPLESITIKNLAKSEVGAFAFYNCSYLMQVDLPATITKVGEYAFSGTEINKFDAGKLVSIGESAFENCTNLTEFDLQDNKSLNSIGAGAFYNCYSLASFSLPSTVTEIKNNTFQECAALSQLELGGSLKSIGDYAFASCQSLTSVAVPQSVDSIGFGAFVQCNALQEISLPFIGGSAGRNQYLSYIFGSSSALWEGYIPVTLKKVIVAKASEIANYAFYKCAPIKEIIIESDYTRIGNYAFSGCKSLKNFVIPASVTQIGTEAFANCFRLFELFNLSELGIQTASTDYGSAGKYALKVYSSLSQQRIPKIHTDGFELGQSSAGKWYLLDYTGNKTELSLPEFPNYNGNPINSYEVIHHMAAENQTIKRVTVPSSVTAIGEYAFQNCRALTQVFLPDSVSFVGFAAFEGCYEIREMILPFIGNTRTDNRYFSYIFGATNREATGFTPDYLTDLTIRTAADIPNYAFYELKKLKNIRLPSDYRSIGSFAFYKCTSLTRIDLPLNLVSIGERAFSLCQTLDLVRVPAGVTSIGQGAFQGCHSLSKLTLPFVGGSRSDNRYFNYIFGGSGYSNYDLVPYALNTVILTHESDLPNFAFYSCYNIVSITLPDSLTKIGDNAFAYCQSLKEVSFPSALQTIGERAFYSCTKLEKVTLRSRAVIKNDAFYDCSCLLEVYDLGGLNVTEGSKDNGYLGFYAMAVYTSLQDAPIQEVTINDIVFKNFKDNWTVTDYIGYKTDLKLSAFEYQGKTISSYGIKSGAFNDKSHPINLTIGKEVVSIDKQAFSNHYGLKTVVFENSELTELKEYAFSTCENLESVILPQKLKKIGYAAFIGCEQLYSIVIPQSVTEIGESAFNNCFALSDVCNLSALGITKGSPLHGEVALYALRVSATAGALPTLVVSDNRFMLFESKWYFISSNYINNSNTLALPKTFDFGQTTVSSYVLKESALYNKYYTRLFIPQGVESIYAYGSEYAPGIDEIYYGGTQQQWRDLLAAAPNSKLKNIFTFYNRYGL